MRNFSRNNISARDFRKIVTCGLLACVLSGCGNQTVYDLIPQHQLTMLQAESFMKPEGGYLLRPEHEAPAQTMQPATQAPSWKQQISRAPEPMQGEQGGAISVSAMLQQTLQYAANREESE